MLKAYTFLWKMLHVSCFCCNNNFQFVLAVHNDDIVGNGLLGATGRPTPVRLSRSCSTMLKYFLSVLMCKYIFLHEPNDSIWKLPFDPISPIYKNKDCKIVLFTLTKRMFYLIRSRTSTYVVMQILLLMVVFRF